MIINFIRGLFMALADSVPGVSGGTIAFIMGFYDKFINSLDRLIYGSSKERKESLIFLIKLGIGWVVGMVIASLVLASLFEKNIYEISSLFLGFIIFSIPLIIKEEKKDLKGKYINLIFTLIGIFVVVLITKLNPVSSSKSTVDITHLNIGLIFYIMLAGALAISAMVLPGISGSTLLLIFGLYISIMTGIKEILHFNFSYLPALICFGIGVIIGILSIIKIIKKALIKYRSQTIYLVIGLMLGSIYAIIMGPTTLKIPRNPLSFNTFNILFFIIGAIIIIGLDKIKVLLSKDNSNND